MRQSRNPNSNPNPRNNRSKAFGLGTGVALVLALGVALLRNTPACPHSRTSPSFPVRHAASQPALTHPLRVAFYNIEFFNEQVGPERLARLKAIVGKIDADIWGLAEISNRAALQKLFDPGSHEIMIHDSPKGGQEVALVIRKPLYFTDPVARMVFDGPQYDAAFPADRNLLHGVVRLPDGPEVHCFVVHAKSRYGGRLKSEERRREHARLIVQYLKNNFNLHEVPLLLLGDFNDTPDDASLNILETGNPNAPPGMETDPDPFLVDLGEPLWAKDMPTIGLTRKDLGPDGRLKLVKPGVRSFNMDAITRQTEPKTVKPVMFDIILTSPWLARRLSPAGMQIYDQTNAVESSATVPGGRNTDTTRASDHLPVYADFGLN